MAVNYTNAVKALRLNSTRTHFVNGTIEIGTTGFTTILATFTLTATAGSVTNDIWTLALTNSTVTATGTGTAAAARIKTSGGVIDLSGLTVSTTGADINLNNTSIATGQNVTLSSATITHAL